MHTHYMPKERNKPWIGRGGQIQNIPPRNSRKHIPAYANHFELSIFFTIELFNSFQLGSSAAIQYELGMCNQITAIERIAINRRRMRINQYRIHHNVVVWPMTSRTTTTLFCIILFGRLIESERDSTIYK